MKRIGMLENESGYAIFLGCSPSQRNLSGFTTVRFLLILELEMLAKHIPYKKYFVPDK